MMPELGKYAMTVLASYGATLALLALLVGATLWRSVRVRRQLEEVETRKEARKNGQA